MALSNAIRLLSGLLSVISVLPSPVTAHGFVAYVVSDNKLYWGWNPWNGSPDAPGPPPYKPQNTVGWPNGAVDSGYVWPDRYDQPEIICHRNATPAPAHIPVRAGSTLHLQWRSWPNSHSGPLLTYVAPCVGTSNGCADVDETKLRFLKIDDSAPGFLGYDVEPKGYLRFGDNAPAGTWSTDILIARNFSWQVAVPEGLPPGAYVLRHEALNLEYAASENRAQHFVWCMNLWVTSGSGSPANPVDLSKGVWAMGMYKADEPGLELNIYEKRETYDLPGPPLAAGAKPIPPSEQHPQTFSELGTPVRVSGQTAELWPYDEEGAYRMSLVQSGAQFW